MLKKGYCYKCKTKNEERHIFDVNPEAEVCFCPHCLKELNPQSAILAYEYFIAQRNIKAEKTLFRYCDPERALYEFSDVIDLEKNNVEARFGRLLSMVYMSKLNKTYFKEVAILLKQDSDILFKPNCGTTFYFKFLRKIDCAIDDFICSLGNKLEYKNVFHNITCIEYYCRIMQDVLALKQSLLDEFGYIVSVKKESVHLNQYFQKVEDDVKKETNILKKDFLCRDGYSYKFSGVNKHDHPILFKKKECERSKISKIRLKFYLNRFKKAKKINEVFKTNCKLVHFNKISTRLIPIFAILLIGSLISFFIFKDTAILNLVFLISTSSIALIIVIFFILQICFSNIIRKVCYKID